MAKWLDKILAAGVSETIAQVSNLAEAHTGKKERDIAIASLLAAQANAQLALIKEELGVRERIMVAELQQDNVATKMSRPAIIYTGLLAMLVDGIAAIDFTMPDRFWQGWMIAVSLYAVGRSAEKLGSAGTLGNVASMITGNNKKQVSLLES